MDRRGDRALPTGPPLGRRRMDAVHFASERRASGLGMDGVRGLRGHVRVPWGSRAHEAGVERWRRALQVAARSASADAESRRKSRGGGEGATEPARWPPVIATEPARWPPVTGGRFQHPLFPFPYRFPFPNRFRALSGRRPSHGRRRPGTGREPSHRRAREASSRLYTLDRSLSRPIRRHRHHLSRPVDPRKRKETEQ
jgi:hypothetical protein